MQFLGPSLFLEIASMPSLASKEGQILRFTHVCGPNRSSRRQAAPNWEPLTSLTSKLIWSVHNPKLRLPEKELLQGLLSLFNLKTNQNFKFYDAKHFPSAGQTSSPTTSVHTDELHTQGSQSNSWSRRTHYFVLRTATPTWDSQWGSQTPARPFPSSGLWKID